MERRSRYETLVNLRKAHVFPAQLLNPSEIQDGVHDSDHLGPWSRWQGDLRAEVVIIGQDWGDLPYFLRNKGVDDAREQTCLNLKSMALAAGWDLGTPQSPLPQPLFFTNAVLGIRAGNGKSGTPPSEWIDDSLPYLTGLLDIVQPRAVVSLGTAAYRATRMALFGRGRDAQLPVAAPLSQVHLLSPIKRPGKPAWFPFYHCGPLGLVNRSRELQLQDWRQLGAWLRS
jgi:DNA polymerase